ncbi:TPA: hypothetical protein QCY38_005862 [Bacillus toyonensis]|nr:hypothetical protein [Bacillus toyonensis]QPW52114.1 hypothetical protein G9298_31390 [Bacillus thuringiensis]HDR7952052.1 hypothetical protein [Bacillus toyonensis]
MPNTDTVNEINQAEIGSKESKAVIADNTYRKNVHNGLTMERRSTKR